MNFAANRCYMIFAEGPIEYPMFSTTCPGVSYSGIKKPEAFHLGWVNRLSGSVKTNSKRIAQSFSASGIALGRRPGRTRKAKHQNAPWPTATQKTWVSIQCRLTTVHTFSPGLKSDILHGKTVRSLLPRNATSHFIAYLMCSRCNFYAHTLCRVPKYYIKAPRRLQHKFYILGIELFACFLWIFIYFSQQKP